MISAEELVGEEQTAWYRLTPVERWRESEKLRPLYLSLGGVLDPEPDTQSPFFDPTAPGACPADGRPGLRVGLDRAAEFSRDTDFTILASPANLARLRRALDDLRAEVVAVPPFEPM